MRKLTVFLAVLLFTSPVWSDTHYVRTDGGTGTQCTGLTDAPYTSGTACAVNHPNWVFPPAGASTTRQASEGDVVVIGTGSYRIGCQNATNCNDANVNVPSCGYAGGPNCVMGGISNNMTVVGCSVTGCSSLSLRPELWGAGRAYQVVNVYGASNVVLKDLEITDHATCGEGNPTLDCGSASNSVLNARIGILATSSTNLTLTNVNVHGTALNGLRGGSMNGATITGSNLDYNGFAGWEPDNCNNDGSCPATGSFSFINTSVSWNGCVENYPAEGTVANGGCYGQGTGGYGDGIASTFGTGAFYLENVNISHNTSDGLDLLYNDGSQPLIIKKSRFEGNVGNQIKAPNTINMEDSFALGNCGFFAGQSFSASGIDNCRAFGSTIAIAFRSGNSSVPKLVNNTITGNGDFLIDASDTCTAGQNIILRNNILAGGAEFNTDGSTPYWHGDGVLDNVGIHYNSGSCQSALSEDYNVCIGPFHSGYTCAGAHSKNVTPTFTGTLKQGPYSSPGYYTGSNYAGQLYLGASDTAAKDSGTTYSGADALDYNYFQRSGTWDIGAVEYGSTPSGGPVPFCGDGTIGSGEQCDGSNLNSQNCVSLGYNQGGTLSCSGSCQFDTSLCSSGLCGNGVLNNLSSFPSTSVIDNFDRANEGPPPTGWLELYQNGTTGLAISSNQLAPTIVSDNCSGYWTASTYGPDSEIYAIVANKGAVGDKIRLWFRTASPGVIADVDGYAVSYSNLSGTDTIAIRKIVNGTSTTISSTISQEVANGDGLGMSVVGNDLVLYYKSGSGPWTALTTVTDTSITAAGYLGVDLSTGSGGLTLRLDSISGGKTNYSSEQCDDGNLINGDGCDAFCNIEAETGRLPGITFGGCNQTGVKAR